MVRHPHPVDARNAASLLSIGLQWTGSALDDISRRRIDAWFRNPSDDAMVEQVRSTEPMDRV